MAQTPTPELPIRVLVVDDEVNHAEAVAESLERIGYQCALAHSGRAGIARLDAESFDLVITDLVMGDEDGMAVLRKVQEEYPETETIMMTGHGSIKNAVQAMQRGAYNYLTKPLDLDEVRETVERASQSVRLLRMNQNLRRQLDEKFGFEGIVGSSPAMVQVIQSLQNIAPTSATVLIQGESGTGKELIAKAIHNNSPRKEKAFVPLNCAALSESILESELFGHEKGAFTGADRQRKGRFEYADGGTLFLDEVGDMPMATQIKLLRVIEENEIMRVGSNEPVKVNVRLLSATHRNLEDAVAEGLFRQDLYYRLKVVTVQLPVLRERRSDIPLLVEAFARELAEKHGLSLQGVDPAVNRVLRQFPWPGNVRQLKNVVESMVVMARGDVLTPELIPPEISAPAQHDAGDTADGLVGRSLADIERYYIEQTLELAGGNREDTANILGIGERTLYRKLKEYGSSEPNSL